MPYPIVFFFYRIAYYLVRIAFFFYYRISFEGRENVPKGTAVIFASNHRSYLDPVLVAMAAPHPFNFIAKEPLFRNPVFGGFIRLMGAFPTADAKHPDYDMLSEATKRLDKRRHLTIFPEGTRHTDGKVGRGKSGVCVLAARSGKPVVPIGLVFDSNNLHFRSRICVRVGQAPVRRRLWTERRLHPPRNACHAKRHHGQHQIYGGGEPAVPDPSRCAETPHFDRDRSGQKTGDSGTEKTGRTSCRHYGGMIAYG